MTEHLHLSDRDRALLVGLADGTLRGRSRARAEARLRTLPGAAALLDGQRRVRRALHDGPVPAPGAAPALVRPRAERSRAWVPRAVALGALVAALLGLFVLPTGADRPVVARAAALAEQPATSAAPPSVGRVLRADVQGVAFPDWSDQFGWAATGTRRDRIDGRAATTVFYEHMGHRIAYTILPGPPAEPPADARVVRRDGLEIALSHDPRHGGHDIAVFERDGRTCVIAGHVEEVATLIELAAWTGGGDVRS